MKLGFKKLIKAVCIILPLLLICVATISLLMFLYLPNKLINSTRVQNYISDISKENCGLDLTIKNPYIKTSLKPVIDFSIDKLYLAKDSNTLVDLDNFKISLGYKNILNREFKLNYLSADNLVIKSDELANALDIKSSDNNQNALEGWKFNFYDSKINLNKLYVTYKQPNSSLISVNAKDVNLDYKGEYSFLNFNATSKISNKNKDYVNISLSAKDKIKIYKDSVEVNSVNMLVNNSKVDVISRYNNNSLYINAKSNLFYLVDVFSIVNSDFVVPTGSQLLKPVNKPSGSVKFDVNYLDGNLSGYVSAANTKAHIKDLTGLPINIQTGKIQISKDKISFVDLVGYYGKNKNNKLKITGDIKDYYKTFDSHIDISTLITNEFLKTYLAPLVSNTVLSLSQPTKTKIIYKAKNGIMDILWFAKVPKGVEFLVNNNKSESSSFLTNFDRAVVGAFNITGNNLDIKKVNYYIAPDIHRGQKYTPIMTFNGKTTLSGKIDNVGFAFGKPIPCEFLNIFVGDNTFKKGTIEGNLSLVFKNNIPILNADMQIDKTLLPNQRLFIKSAKLTTDNNLIKVVMDGGFKRIRYNFSGKIKNEIAPPFVIKDMTLNIDDIDVEKLLVSTNGEHQENSNVENINSENDISSDDDYFFDTNLVRIESSNLVIKQGHYKDLNFSDINAKMSLDEKGIMRFASNRFNIADGISTLRGESDLKNFTHHFRLGVRDVDSNLMAKVLLNLDKEISGKARGLLDLTTDKDLKLSGNMKFEIENGAIGKIGLVEYLLKVASVFRNPIVMISPSVIMDIVNVPEGKFDKITGSIDLRNNVAYKIDIKSYANTLSALIKGRFDMDKHDASLRIYTRFSTEKKSIFGFLRNISLNTLANKVQLNTKNDYSYYKTEIADLPQIEIGEEKSQIFLTTIEGDVEHNNFLSSLKKIK